MKQISYLPRWYDKRDIMAKQKELDEAIDELMESGLLNEAIKSELSDLYHQFYLWGDTYSRNQQIRKVNNLILMVNMKEAK